jgi:sensor c-di-GMP phosphodiesterase-like protein
MVGCFSAATAWIALDQISEISKSQDRAAIVAQGIFEESRDLLRILNSQYKPVCDEINLRELRKELFPLERVGDIGVLDVNGLLLCSTTSGQIEKSSSALIPDAFLVNQFGERFAVNFNADIIAGKVATNALIIQSGLFNIVIRPGFSQALTASGVQSIKLISAHNQVNKLFEHPNLDSDWRKALLKSDWATQDTDGYSWSFGAFLSIRQIPDTPVILQSVVTWRQFVGDYKSIFLLLICTIAFMGMLVYGELNSRFGDWRHLSHRIGSLLDEKNLVCMYQPIIDMQTNDVVGCEVLMRLRDGSKLLFPDTIIPSIIERHLTWTLDKLVVKVALAELSLYLPDLRDFKVAFNFFPRNVEVTKVHGVITECLERTPHYGLRFNVEVIEQHYEGSIVKEIVALRKKGYLISVDDFGTGYSNLGSIKSISPDYLKIDKSFVFDMEDATVRASLIPEIINIARAVNAKLIAEGIENESQKSLLHALGVEFGQGYLFARPMDIHAFSEFLKSKRTDK